MTSPEKNLGPSPDLYKPDLYNNNEYTIPDLLIQITFLFVKVEEEAEHDWYLYKSVLYSRNGQAVLKLLSEFGATSHMEITNLVNISEQSANYHLQKLIQTGLVKVQPLTNDPELKGRYRPFNIYYLKDTPPMKVVEAIHRLKRIVLKNVTKQLVPEESDSSEEVTAMAQDFMKLYKPDHSEWYRVMTRHGYKTQTEWDALLPRLKAEYRRIKEAGV